MFYPKDDTSLGVGNTPNIGEVMMTVGYRQIAGNLDLPIVTKPPVRSLITILKNIPIFKKEPITILIEEPKQEVIPTRLVPIELSQPEKILPIIIEEPMPTKKVTTKKPIKSAKPIYESKTFWLNILGIAASLAEVLPPEYAMPTLAIANIGMRIITDSSITILPKQ